MQTVDVNKFMTTSVDELEESGARVSGLTPRQCNALLVGTRIVGGETVADLVEFRQSNDDFRGDVEDIRSLRQFVNFHMARVGREKDARSLEFAHDKLALVETQAQVDAATIAKTDYKSGLITMSQELDAELGTSFFQSITSAVEDLSVDTRHMTWWNMLRSAMIDRVLIAGDQIEWSDATHAIVYGKGAEDGAEALAEATGDSLDQFMGGSSGESDA